MHRALLIVEVIEHVFDCLGEDFDILSGGANSGTLSSLARTCQIFKEPALDALWENLAGIEPLIRCLPKDVWRTSSIGELGLGPGLDTIVKLNRSLTAQDWAVIRKYTPRVRRLYQVSAGRVYSGELLELSLAPHDMFPLLPNLRHLQWSLMPSDDIPFVRMFLPSTLESIQYGISIRFSDLREASLLSALGYLIPRVQHVQCSLYPGVHRGVDSFSRSVCCWKNLKLLYCEKLTDEALVHIAGLSTLQHLGMTLGPQSSLQGLRRLVQSSPFANLSSLSLATCDLDAAVAFVDEMSLSLIDFHVSVLNNTCSNRIADTFKVIAKGDRALEKVKIMNWVGDENSIGPENYAFIPQKVVMTIFTFRPLFKSNHLRVLEVDALCSLALGDAEIIELARAFPLLEKLSLNPTYGWRTSLAITLFGLFSVACLCPHLLFLGIEFDGVATEKTNSAQNAPLNVDIFSNTAIRKLSVGNSTIDDPRTVASLLFRVMPNLECVSGRSVLSFNGEDMDWAGEYSRNSRRWARVERILSHLRSRGTNARNHEDSSDTDEDTFEQAWEGFQEVS
ncbi:hypothetical protein CONPUDRAFT_164585 [Coniophora puteana RWD-64-598 SS2]|uniref:RNI-like protein n=1 Tax=Coniophora puteana (strain RWD-64-598) TaxID=741705 RepID=A0A5M3MT47_CONPW|nr:uncharacterized protein CONPUDRAFT_164585 [Coniophora puteana RWD-64-598 SS2]EIW81825.1 hypothetical protein CONPUDRAFT_164585 [Coniophora puteana RWD-64-598 SS2]